MYIEDPFPFSVAGHCGISAAGLVLAEQLLLLGCMRLRVWGLNTGKSRFHYQFPILSLIMVMQFQFSVPMPHLQNRYKECLFKVLGFNVYKVTEMPS